MRAGTVALHARTGRIFRWPASRIQLSARLAGHRFPGCLLARAAQNSLRRDSLPRGNRARWGRSPGFRARGMANNRNPIAIVVPCHRVIASNGTLCGYGGGLDVKRKLLELEGALSGTLAA